MLVLLHNCQQPTEYLQIETNACAIISILYAFGVYLLTGADGPAKSIGNLYYFSWLSFLSAVLLFLDCFEKITSSYRSAITNNMNNNGRYASLTICSEDDSEEDEDHDTHGHPNSNNNDDDSGSPFFECDDSSYTEDPHQVYSTGTGNLTNPNQGYYGNNHYSTAW